MELYIRIKDGEPFEHPIFGDNFREAFPDVDVNNLPSDFAKFERIQAPILGPYEKNQSVRYEIGEDGICRDVWSCEKMTEEEVIAKQEAVKKFWAENEKTPKTWIFNEESCSFVPPAGESVKIVPSAA
jgi:hypothetical protein